MLKKILLIAFAINVSLISWGQYSIGTPISITNDDDSFGYRSPKVALDSNGDLLIFWMRTGNNEAFFFSKKDASGFTAPLEIPLNGLNPNLWSGSLGPNMAAGGGHVYVTFEIYGDAIYVIHSPDDGLNWEDPMAVFTPPNDRRATIPSIAVDSSGNAYVAYVNTNAQEEDAYYGLVKTSDQGATYSNEVVISDQSAGSEVCECCNGSIDVADNGDVFMGYRNNDSNLRDNWLARSTDGGDSFSAYYDMDETDWLAAVCPSSGPHFYVENNTVLMSFFSAASGWGAGTFYSSLDLDTEEISSTLSMPTGDPTSIQQNRPRVAGSGDKMIMVFQENYDGDNDIAMTYSNSGPLGFGNSSAQITTATGAQQFPQVIASNGLFHVVYEDVVSKTVLYQEVSVFSTGVNELVGLDFTLFPNPVSETMHINVPNDWTIDRISIADCVGKVLRSENGNARSIDISEFENGSYFLILKIEGARTTQKFQVIR